MPETLTMRHKNKILHCRMSEGLKERAERAARADNRTLTSIIEDALKDYLPKLEKRLAGLEQPTRG